MPGVVFGVKRPEAPGDLVAIPVDVDDLTSNSSPTEATCSQLATGGVPEHRGKANDLVLGGSCGCIKEQNRSSESPCHS